MSSTCLVTGAAGFIGSHIAEALYYKGHRLILIDNLVNGKLENLAPWYRADQCQFIKADVSEYSAIRQHFLGVDYVFHNAASKCTVCTDNPVKDLLVNALGTLNVCEASHETGVKKVIHASTGSVNEINSYYGNSKNAGENYVKTFKNYHHDFNYSILRYHHVYGPRQDDSDKGGVVPIFIRRISQELPVIIYGDGEQERHFTHVSDVVRANMQCMEDINTDLGCYNLIPNNKATVNQLSYILHELMGRPVKEEHREPKKGDIRTFNVVDRFPLDFKVTLRDGLLDTIAWYQEHYRSAA